MTREATLLALPANDASRRERRLRAKWAELDYGDPNMAAQNKRCLHVFRRADGTAYDIEAVIFREPSGACFTGRGSSRDITFPYVPKREYVGVTEAA